MVYYNSLSCNNLFFSVLQSYPHKILTGRRNKMPTLRQTDGLCGFTKRSESDYDCFGTGHSSTTISAGLGKKSYSSSSGCRIEYFYDP